MTEEYLIRNCAPTLAGLKTGSLFSCPCPDREKLRCSLRQLNRQLKAKGLRLLPLRFTDTKALLYLFRPGKLRQDLSREDARQLLDCQGYDCENCEKCVAQLGKKLRKEEEFPHEIGLFLGYPPEDVLGFLTQGPDCCKCSGCWKVYGDADAAQKKFAQFRHCTKVYCDRWAKGTNIERLTVADWRGSA